MNMTDRINVMIELNGKILIDDNKVYTFHKRIKDNLELQENINSCVFCKSAINLVCKNNIYVCTECIEKLKNAKSGDYFY